jgi:hypothetical protein
MLWKMLMNSVVSFDRVTEPLMRDILDIIGLVPSLCYSIIPKCCVQQFTVEFHHANGQLDDDITAGTNMQNNQLVLSNGKNHNSAVFSTKGYSLGDYAEVEFRFCSWESLQCAMKLHGKSQAELKSSGNWEFIR